MKSLTTHFPHMPDPISPIYHRLYFLTPLFLYVTPQLSHPSCHTPVVTPQWSHPNCLTALFPIYQRRSFVLPFDGQATSKGETRSTQVMADHVLLVGGGGGARGPPPPPPGTPPLTHVLTPPAPPSAPVQRRCSSTVSGTSTPRRRLSSTRTPSRGFRFCRALSLSSAGVSSPLSLRASLRRWPRV